MRVTEFGRRCPIDYKDGWAIHYRSETDLYKITAGVAFLENHANDWTKYILANRTKGVEWTEEMLEEIKRQFEHLYELRWTDAEIEYLYTIPFLKDHRGYIEFLRNNTLDRRYVKIWLDDKKQLHIEAEGPVYIVSQFEIYTLVIVSYVWNIFNDTYENIYNEGIKRWKEKVEKFRNGTYTFKCAEFGLRRRNLAELQDFIANDGCDEDIFVGTSNVYLAMCYGAKAIGTYGHEYVQIFQGREGVQLAYTNKMALDEWLKTFNGNLGTALTDTLTTKLFLMDFDLLQAKQYDGVRLDSGDDYMSTDMFVEHYNSLGINPKTKTILYSNGYDFDKAQAMYDYAKDKVKPAFGIGTYISNDSTVKPLNIVMKLQEVNGRPVAKISDDVGKTMCQSSSYIAYLKMAINWRLENDGKRNIKD